MDFCVSQVSFLVTNAILGVGFFIGLPCNIVVIITILSTPVLRSRLTNLLIVNLCLTDLVTVVVDIPLIWMITYSNYYKSEFSSFQKVHACDIQVFCHALGISGQATALITIAYERFHTISSPFEKNAIRTRTLLFASICWFVAAALAITQLAGAKETITHDICNGFVEVDHSSTKYVVVAFGSVAFFIIVIYYIGILYLVKKHLHKFDQKIGSTPVPHPSASTNTVAMAMKPQQTVQTPETVEECNIGGDGHASDNDNGAHQIADNEESPAPIYGEVCVRSDANREKGKRKFEAEIAKRLFYIIISFLVIWMPYATLVVVITESTLLTSSSSAQEVTFQVLFCLHILTTLAAALNPLIYALPNKQFRSVLARLCTDQGCRCL